MCAGTAWAAPAPARESLPELGAVPSVPLGTGTTLRGGVSGGGLGAGVPVTRLPAAKPGFYHSFLGPELSRYTESYAYFVGSPAYDFFRDSSSASHFETTESVEHDTVKAVRRAARDWMLEEVGIDQLSITFRPVADALDRFDDRLNAREGSSTEIRLGFSRLYPRLVVDRSTQVGDFRFRLALDGRAGADFRPASGRGPWIGTDVDVRDRAARFRLGLRF